MKHPRLKHNGKKKHKQTIYIADTAYVSYVSHYVAAETKMTPELEINNITKTKLQPNIMYIQMQLSYIWFEIEKRCVHNENKEINPNSNEQYSIIIDEHYFPVNRSSSYQFDLVYLVRVDSKYLWNCS